MKNRGGRREGAGRKKGVSLKSETEKKKRWATRLHPAIIEWLRNQKEPASQIIERLVKKEMKRNAKR